MRGFGIVPVRMVAACGAAAGLLLAVPAARAAGGPWTRGGIVAADWHGGWHGGGWGWHGGGWHGGWHGGWGWGGGWRGGWGWGGYIAPYPYPYAYAYPYPYPYAYAYPYVYQPPVVISPY